MSINYIESIVRERLDGSSQQRHVCHHLDWTQLPYYGESSLFRAAIPQWVFYLALTISIIAIAAA